MADQSAGAFSGNLRCRGSKNGVNQGKPARLRGNSQQAAGELKIHQAQRIDDGRVFEFGDGNEQGFNRRRVFYRIARQEQIDVVGGKDRAL